MATFGPDQRVTVTGASGELTLTLSTATRGTGAGVGSGTAGMAFGSNVRLHNGHRPLPRQIRQRLLLSVPAPRQLGQPPMFLQTEQADADPATAELWPHAVCQRDQDAAGRCGVLRGR